MIGLSYTLGLDLGEPEHVVLVVLRFISLSESFGYIPWQRSSAQDGSFLICVLSLKRT